MIRVYSVTVRRPLAGLVLGLGLLGVGVALAVVGFAVLAGVTVVGGAIGAGMMLYRRLAPPSAGRVKAAPDVTLDALARPTPAGSFVGVAENVRKLADAENHGLAKVQGSAEPAAGVQRAIDE
jgi:hypothetical protein